jgi:tetratricopeptide (TPR) repeat protein
LAKHTHTPGMIEELESAADRLASWIASNAWLVGGVLVVVLGSAGAWGGYRSWSQGREEAASNALDRTRTAYLFAFGAQPGTIEEPELANPALAEAIRDEYVGEFKAVAEEHSGTVAGTLALFEAAELLNRLGRPKQTEEIWRQALASASGNPGLYGILQQRVAQAHEAREAWAEAAAAHQEAGRTAGYPLRYWALVDAARCYATAGEPERALALYEEVEREAPDLNLPDHLRAQFRELRAVARR